MMEEQEERDLELALQLQEQEVKDRRARVMGRQHRPRVNLGSWTSCIYAVASCFLVTIALFILILLLLQQNKKYNNILEPDW